MKTKTTLLVVGIIGTFLGLLLPPVRAQSTTFTYQGRLTLSGTNFDGTAVFKPTLWNDLGHGSQVAANIPSATTVEVSDGLFVLPLDFGDIPFSAGEGRWLQLEVRSGNTFVPLTPRTLLTPAPCAITAYRLSGNVSVSQLPPGVSLLGPSIESAEIRDGTVTSADIANGTITPVNVDVGSFDSVFWRLGGNSGTSDGTHFLGTTDDQPLELRVNGSRVLRLENVDNGSFRSVNVIGGCDSNSIATGVVGATLFGGGQSTDGALGGTDAANHVLKDFGTVGGGGLNTTGGEGATVAGGYANSASSKGTTVGGGIVNRALGEEATVGGGGGNRATNILATVGGGGGNIAGGVAASVSGGLLNVAIGESATVGGGAHNEALGDHATVSGGQSNVSGYFAAVGGGLQNSAGGHGATVAGGEWNVAGWSYATVGGGRMNFVGKGAALSVICGGGTNAVGLGTEAAGIVGGQENEVWKDADFSCIGGGIRNVIAENAHWATIPGGTDNLAGGDGSLAAGTRAKALHRGSFVWADSTAADFASTTSDQLSVRANGGTRIVGSGGFSNPQLILNKTGGDHARLRFGVDSNPTWDIAVSGGATPQMKFYHAGFNRMVIDAAGNVSATSFDQTCDRAAKENFEPVDVQEVLDKVAALSITHWNYRADQTRRHIGPVAQDFYAAFGVGPDDKHIATVDADGVALAAIQALNDRVETRSQESELHIQELRTENMKLKSELAELRELLHSFLPKTNGRAK